jgi:hypothetical protein
VPVALVSTPAPTAAAPDKTPEARTEAPMVRPEPFNPGCTSAPDGHVECPLVANAEPIGVGVPAGTFVRFTNNTGNMLQVNAADAYTGERANWSEWCIYKGELKTAQGPAGVGEVGCATKNAGEDYAPIHWGTGTGLSVAPGEVLYLNSHTEPALESHLYSLTVAVQTTGLHSWRMPQVDEVIPCDGQERATVWSAWENTTGAELHLTGASIYAEAGGASNTLSGLACLYVLTADGAEKYRNCDAALRTRGDVSFPTVIIAPGERLAAQAVNACAAPAVWDWVAFLRVW